MNYVPKTTSALRHTGICDPDGNGVVGVNYTGEAETYAFYDIAGNLARCDTAADHIEAGAVQRAPVCGNGVQEGEENCDGTDFGGATCQTYGYASGTLRCNACNLYFKNCHRYQQ
jgi:hypothetical protein